MRDYDDEDIEDEFDEFLSDNRRELMEQFCEQHEQEFRDFIKEEYMAYKDSFSERRELEKSRL